MRETVQVYMHQSCTKHNHGNRMYACLFTAIRPCNNGGGCSHICAVVNGSAQCSCPVGYHLTNNTQCIGETSVHYMHFNQIFIASAYTIQLIRRWLFCFTNTDRDECAQYNPCDQVCTNLVGSFKCSCRPGYQYNDESNHCEGDL